jgi:hypothetical protein
MRNTQEREAVRNKKFYARSVRKYEKAKAKAEARAALPDHALRCGWEVDRTIMYTNAPDMTCSFCLRARARLHTAYVVMYEASWLAPPSERGLLVG